MKKSQKEGAIAGIFNAEDGTALYYEVIGRGRPLIFCYGLTCQREHWYRQTRHFMKDYQVITFDYRGHHASAVPHNDRNLTLDWCARDVVRLAQHLQLKEAVALGHSMGVPVAMKASVLAPEIFRALVLICGAASNPFQHMFNTPKMEGVFRVYSTISEWVPETLAVLWKQFTRKNSFNFWVASRFGFNPSQVPEQDVQLYLDGVHNTPQIVFYRFLRDYSQLDGEELLARVNVPSLFIAGAQDRMTPPDVVRQMAHKTPRSEFLEVAYGSHNAHLDYAEIVNAAIDNFLKELDYQ